MANGLAWKDMDDPKKFEFLHQWCDNLSVAVQRLGAANQEILRRLQAVEEKVAGASSKPR
jgi:hypothetical protein